ncbi:MAG: hypothetical protein WB460_03310 [Candidatus Acidiferrales bacterium]
MAPQGTTSSPVSTPTAGEVFPDGTALELLRDPGAPEKLTLVLCREGVLDIKPQMPYANRVYTPMSIDARIAKAVRFPTRVAPSESTKELFAAAYALLSGYLGQLDACTTALAFTMFASWLSPVLPMAPILSIFAPAGTPKNLVLQLLGILCRRPLHLVGLRRGDLARVPMSLQPTLLLEEPDLKPAMEAILNASSQRGAHVPDGRGVLELFGPKIIISRKPPHGAALETDVLRAALIPVTGQLPPLDKKTEEEIADEFHSRFLAYFLRNASSVQCPNFDVSQFSPPVQDLARAFGAAIVGDDELQRKILPLLRVQDEEVRADRARAGDAVVVEASLSFIHQNGWTKVRTDSIADKVGAIYKGRGSDQRPSAESVGRALKRLGIPSGRINRAGNGIELSVATCQLIHKLALSYGVRAMEGGLRSDCRYCRELEPAISQAAT